MFIVIGAGVNGLATACALAERGCSVTVLERETIAHAWSSSRGPSKAIRHEYGAMEIYSRMAARSIELWSELVASSGRALYTRTGVLTLGQEGDEYVLPGLEAMTAMGLPVHRLTPQQCASQFPQFVPDSFSAITWNESGGYLAASECVHALADRLRAAGGIVRENCAVTAIDPDSARPSVTLAGGERLHADRIVVTAGPWVHELLGDLDLPVRATRQQVCYFTGVSASEFAADRFPVFLADGRYYGFPIASDGRLKIASHEIGEEVGPSIGYGDDRDAAQRCIDFLRRVIPGAASGTFAGIDRCMYDVTPDENFILDYHPRSRSVVIGSGFSGHGFKFGILTGRLLASLVLDEEPEIPLNLFRLDRWSGESPLPSNWTRGF